ncbi:hypothetical protein FNV43_RR07370 [Rhamnella rubrinervis]|uniref:Uncharacterized protein n=1 Tax=Rhamnella rubrinervis TaxID=2594499 RepID=A0A8K0HGD7_9ROSA|nr:hypothetical protein FNV43_RR07370 [Rhamnella rubrinervis]
MLVVTRILGILNYDENGAAMISSLNGQVVRLLVSSLSPYTSFNKSLKISCLSSSFINPTSGSLILEASVGCLLASCLSPPRVLSTYLRSSCSYELKQAVISSRAARLLFWKLAIILPSFPCRMSQGSRLLDSSIWDSVGSAIITPQHVLLSFTRKGCKDLNSKAKIVLVSLLMGSLRGFNHVGVEEMDKKTYPRRDYEDSNTNSTTVWDVDCSEPKPPSPAPSLFCSGGVLPHSRKYSFQLGDHQLLDLWKGQADLPFLKSFIFSYKTYKITRRTGHLAGVDVDCLDKACFSLAFANLFNGAIVVLVAIDGDEDRVIFLIPNVDKHRGERDG